MTARNFTEMSSHLAQLVGKGILSSKVNVMPNAKPGREKTLGAQNIYATVFGWKRVGKW